METSKQLTEKGQRDLELINRALNNSDQHAYTDLLSYYWDTLYFMMLKMTKDPHDAEDRTIEAFGKAFKNLKQYTPKFAFSTWLFKIASNNCIDFLVKKNKGVPIYEPIERGLNIDVSHRIADSNLDPEEALIREQKIDIMQNIVHRLKPRYKKIIEMRYLKDYSYNEIIDELDLPLGTVKVLLFRGRKLLYHLLQDSRELI